jgi:hypothetical protein
VNEGFKRWGLHKRLSCFGRDSQKLDDVLNSFDFAGKSAYLRKCNR